MLKTYKNLIENALPVLNGFKNPETKIIDPDVTDKIIDFQLWFNPVFLKYNAGLDALRNKFGIGVDVEVNEFGKFLSGDIELLKSFNHAFEHYIKKEIPVCPISFEKEELKGSIINASIKLSMIDAGILK